MSQLNETIVSNIISILDHFNVSYKEYNNRIALSCPIHGSNNDESLSISLKDNSKGIWKCWSNHCEEELIQDGEGQRKRGKFVTSLIRELLKIKYSKDFTYIDTIKWCSTFLNVKLTSEDQKNLEYIKIGRILSKERVSEEDGITRSLIRSKLKIPSKYFIDRGFSPQILDKYDVGYCGTPKKEMYTRVVVPVYDDNHKYMVGCVGRNINPKCPKCGKFHMKNKCPSNPIEKKWSNKWINSDKFNCANYLYNFWFAKDHIAKTGTVILVEGQGDVWKLEESGYNNALGLFGDDLNDQQKIALDSLNAFNLILAMDSDDAGIKGKKRIIEKCERYYNIYPIDLPKKDVGDMTICEIKNIFDKILEKL